MAYGDFKDLARRTASDKVLRDKAFNVAKNIKYDGYQRSLASMVYNILIKKPRVVVLIMKLNKINNWLKNHTNQLLNWHPKPRMFGVLNLADMQLMTKFNKGTIFIMCHWYF